MRDVYAAVAGWIAERTPYAIATLIDVRNAAPAPRGSSMAVTAGGTIAGDIGAGCYEGEIVEAAIATARDGRARVLELDLTSDDIISGGMTVQFDGQEQTLARMGRIQEEPDRPRREAAWKTVAERRLQDESSVEREARRHA